MAAALLALAVGGVMPCAAAAGPAVAPLVLRADPAVLSGQLPNGLRYAFRPQPVPPGRISLCLYVATGSRHEQADEHGYAHFVEHMAFAGTRDFPGDGAIRALQRYGLSFGAEINAATGRNYTAYEIRNLPASDPAALATALRVLRNFADGVNFEPGAVDRERGVILAERNVRAGRISYWWGRELEFLAPYLEEMGDNEFAAVFGATPMGRGQIGTERTLKRATPERLRAFHERWYRPERMVLAAAGELDGRRLAALVAAEFGPMQTRAEAGFEAPIEVPAVDAASRTLTFAEAQSPVEIVTLTSVLPGAVAAAPARIREELAEAIVLEIVERRLVRSLAVPAEISSMLSHEVPGWTVALLRLRAAPADWSAAAVAVEAEVRRAIQYGFSAEEVAAAAEAQRGRLRWSERDAPNRPAREVAVALAHASAGGLVLPSAADERRLAETALAQLTRDDCAAAAARLWPANALRLVLTGPVALAETDSAAARHALLLARTGPVEPPAPAVASEALPEEHFGMLGRVGGEEHNAALDCWFVQFDNGVRLNFKSTPFEKDHVRVRVSFGYGLLGTAPGREGLAYSIALLYHGGTVTLTPEQVRTALDRNEIKDTYGFGADRLGFSANCPAGSLEMALRLFAAHLVKPGFRSVGSTRAHSFIDGQSVRYDRSAAGVAEDRLREYLFGGHHALTRPRRADTERITDEEMREWIEPQLETSPVEVAVVGDIGLDEVTTAVARTFGALPLRSTVDPMAEQRAYTPGEAPQRLDVKFAGADSVASVALAWRLPDVVGQEDDCRMQLLANVLEDRVRIRLRQEMGKTYSPVVGLQAERALTPAMLYVRCRIETAPRQVERVAAAAKAVVAELVRGGITEEELERARLPLIRQAEDNAASNSWWLYVLGEAQTKPQFLEGQGERTRILAAATRAELDALARLLFAPERLCEVRALPE